MKTRTMWFKRAAMLSAMAVCALAVTEVFAVSKSQFKASVTGIAVVDDYMICYDSAAASSVHFSSPSTHLVVPYGKSVLVRMSYDFPDGYGARLWSSGYGANFNGAGTYYENMSGVYYGSGTAFGFFGIHDLSKTAMVETITVRTGAILSDSGDTTYWNLSTVSVNIKFKGPDVKIELAASDGTVPSGIDINWTDDGSEQYELFRSMSKTGPFNRIAVVTTNAYFDSSVEWGRPYWYYVNRVSGQKGASSKADDKPDSNVDEGLGKSNGELPKIVKIDFPEFWLLQDPNTDAGNEFVITWNDFDTTQYRVSGFSATATRNGTEIGPCSYAGEAPGQRWSGMSCKYQFRSIFKNASGQVVRRLKINSPGEWHLSISWTVEVAERDGNGAITGYKPYKPNANGEPEKLHSAESSNKKISVFFAKFDNLFGMPNWRYWWAKSDQANVSHLDDFAYDHTLESRNWAGSNGCKHKNRNGESVILLDQVNDSPPVGFPVICKLKSNSFVSEYKISNLAPCQGTVFTASAGKYQGRRVGNSEVGIAKLACTIAHERKHGALNEELYNHTGWYCFLVRDWTTARHDLTRAQDVKTKLLQTGVTSGAYYDSVISALAANVVTDLDGDQVRDDKELSDYHSNSNDPDTFDFHKAASGFATYATSGDNEVLAREAESNPVSYSANKDYAIPGTQRLSGCQSLTEAELNSDPRYVAELAKGCFQARASGVGHAQRGNNDGGGDDLEDTYSWTNTVLPEMQDVVSENGINVVSVKAIAPVADTNGLYATLQYAVVMTNTTGEAIRCAVKGYLVDQDTNAVAVAESFADASSNELTTVKLVFDGRLLSGAGATRFSMKCLAIDAVAEWNPTRYFAMRDMPQTEVNIASSAFVKYDLHLIKDSAALTQVLSPNGGCSIEFTCDVESNCDAAYHVLARLEDTNGIFLAEAQSQTFYSGPTNTVVVKFDSSDIYLSYRNGGDILVAATWLVKEGFGTVETLNKVCSLPEIPRDAFRTESNVVQFSNGDVVEPRIYFGNDGLADKLSFFLDVDNLAAEDIDCCLWGTLSNTNGEICVTAVEPINLVAGINHVAVSFSGSAIRNANIDGPYALDMIVLRTMNGNKMIDRISPMHELVAMKASDFGGVPFTVKGAPQYREADGVNLAAVVVTVDVARPDTITASALLVDSEGKYVATAMTSETVGEAGERTLTLSFDPDEVNASGRRGPYTISYLLLKSGIEGVEDIRVEDFEVKNVGDSSLMVFVDAANGDDENDGARSTSAKRTISAAIEAAADGDKVVVADGIYEPFSCTNRNIVIESVNGPRYTIIDGGKTNRCVTCLENGSASTNAVIVGFTLRNGYATAQGGGAVGGTLRNCFIEDCVAETDGGGTCQSSLENCVVARNKAGTYGGGMYYGVADHCTICGNAAGASGGGTYNGTLFSCIVSKNVVGNEESNWINGTFFSCCTYPNRGSDPVVGDPMLVDGWNGDARLRIGSPCIVGDVQICGAYVGEPLEGISISVGVQGTGSVSNNATLVTSGGSATIEAVETVRPFLYWNINGEQITNQVYTLTNITSDVRAIAVFGSFDWYVDAEYGDDANDGSDWDTAKRTLQAAVAAAVDDETIYVEAGTYGPISTDNKRIRIESVNGAELTFIDGGGSNRCATLGTNSAHTNSVLVGFTLLNGRAPQSGSYAYGGGSYYGTLERCIISNCVANGYYAYGGGAYYGNLNNCLVAYNCATSSSYRAYGGGTYGSYLRSTTIARNRAIGVKAAYYGGAYGAWNSAYNSIIWDNEVRSSNASSTYYPNTYATHLYYCCTDGTVSYRQSGCVTNDPQFVDADAGDFHLMVGSPCLNAGYDWFVQGDMDLDWDDRIQGTRVDMGCYEGAEYAAPPGQVTGLRAVRGVLTWDAMSDADGFMVYRSTRRAASSAKYIGMSDKNTYTDETAAEGTTYYYWVTAFNTLGTGTRSELAENLWLDPLVIATNGLPDGRVHDEYSVQLQATGGGQPYRWEAVVPGYAVSSNDSTFATTGTAKGWYADDNYWTLALPFDFPFYGRTYRTAYVSSNGTISFGQGVSSTSYSSSTFLNNAMIAVLWKDLRTDGSGDIFVTPGETSVTIRWSAVYLGGNNEVNFSATLHADGRIVLSYGDGNTKGGMCGISAGDGERGIIARNNSTSWSNAKDIVFADGGYAASPEGLPDGLMLFEDGVLSGVATKDGSYAFYVRVTDAMGDSQVAEFQLEVEKNPIVLHVDATSGDDANGGLSMESAKRSLQRAIDSALDDDTILVAPGSYAPISTGNKRIRIESVSGAELTFIDGGGSNRCATLGTNSAHTNSVLVGFTLLNGRARQSGRYAYGGGSYYGTLERCIISNCVANGYYAYGGGAYYGYLNNCLVAYNCATSSSYRAYGGGTYGSYLRSTTIARNRAIGMNAAYYGGAYGDGKSAYNSIIWDNEVRSSNASRTYYPNTYATYLYYCCTDGTVSYRQSGCVTNDPQFVNADTGDFRLSVGSPCLDAGDNSYAFEDKDISGNSRIVDTAVDMGCYEGAVYKVQPGLVTGEPLVITTTTLPEAMEKVGYSTQLEASGGTEPYLWEVVSKGYAYSRADNSFENGGESQEWGSNWTTKCYTLPFGFTFYGKTYDEVYVNENGTLSFGKSFTTTSPTWWEDYLDDVPFIAPEWDWTTSSSNMVYVSVTTDAITFSWDVESVYGDCRCAFSATLRRDGTIRFSYGEGNSSYSFAGVSAGDGVHYTVVATRQGGGIGNWVRDVVLRPCYVASTIEMPDGLVLDSSGLLHGTMTMAWTNSIAVRVRDAAGAILVRELPFTITANPNRRPVIENVTPTNAVTFVKVGDSRMFSIVASDPEGTPLSYRWTMDGNSIAGADTSEYTFSPAAEDAGRAIALTCYVSDDLWTDMVLTNWTVKVPRTIYVDAASTNDQWEVDGSSPESAYLSLSRALDYAEVGDTILVAPGEYNEYLDFRSYGIGYGVPDAFITIRSVEGASSTVLMGGLRNYNSNGWQREDWALYYDGRHYERTPLPVLEGFTLRCSEVRNLSLVNCIVKDLDDGTGMYGLSGCRLSDCSVAGCCSSYKLLSSCELTRCTVAGNTVPDGCFAVDEGSLVIDSIVHENTTAAGSVANYNPSIYQGHAWEEPEDGYREWTVDVPCVVFTNSCTYPLPTMVGGGGNIADDPRLVDAANGDLRLRVGSPCIVDGIQTMGAYLGEPVAGAVVAVRVEGHGAVSPMTTVVSDVRDVTFDVSDFTRQFVGFYTNGVFATSAASLVWRNISEDGIVTAVFSNYTFHVDATTGSDANDGLSWTTAKASIQAAVGEALDGEVVYVKAGTYTPINSNGKRICIESVDGKSVTIIDGGGTNRCATLGSTTNTLVRGFRLTNGMASDGGAAYYGSLEDCDVVGNVATRYGGGLYYSVAIRCRIMGNIVQGSSWYARGGGAYYGMLRNCLVAGNAADCSDSGNGGGTYYGTHYNCTIVSNSVSGTSCQGGGAYGGTHYNTIVYGNLATNVPNEVNFVNAYNSLVGIDPLFADSDYRPAAGSLCIDSGNNSYVIDDIDLDGNERIQHYTVDIGCYEYELATPERDADADFAAQMAGTCYGVFVGVGRYTYTSSLAGPTIDATNMQARCITNGYWHDTNTVALLDMAATKNAVRAHLFSLAAKAVSGDTVLYYQSSHGGNNYDQYGNMTKDTCICLHDETYEDYEMAEDLMQFAAGVKVVIILDTCHSAGMFKAMGTSSASSAKSFALRVRDLMAERSMLRKSAKSGITADDIGWIAAADFNQYSWDSLSGGAFTVAMLDGWKSGEADYDGDNRLNFHELWRYAKGIATGYYGEDATDAQCLNENVLLSRFAGTPDSTSNGESTETTPAPVEHVWLDSYPAILAAFGGDYEAMANAPSPGASGSGKMWPNGSPCYMWQDFVAGTSPTNDAVFTATIRMDGDTPVITWEPDTPELRATRVYRTYGKKTLMDANWTDITDKDMSEYHFFKVTVDLP